MKHFLKQIYDIMVNLMGLLFNFIKLLLHWIVVILRYTYKMIVRFIKWFAPKAEKTLDAANVLIEKEREKLPGQIQQVKETVKRNAAEFNEKLPERKAKIIDMANKSAETFNTKLAIATEVIREKADAIKQKTEQHSTEDCEDSDTNMMDEGKRERVTLGTNTFKKRKPLYIAAAACIVALIIGIAVNGKSSSRATHTDSSVEVPEGYTMVNGKILKEIPGSIPTGDPEYVLIKNPMGGLLGRPDYMRIRRPAYNYAGSTDGLPENVRNTVVPVTNYNTSSSDPSPSSSSSSSSNDGTNNNKYKKERDMAQEKKAKEWANRPDATMSDKKYYNDIRSLNTQRYGYHEVP